MTNQITDADVTQLDREMLADEYYAVGWSIAAERVLGVRESPLSDESAALRATARARIEATKAVTPKAAPDRVATVAKILEQRWPRVPASCEVMAREIVAGECPAPIDMILRCPVCREQHVDAPEGAWANPPHRSHLCHKCGTIWRPADVATNGVAAIRTKGSKDGDCPAPVTEGAVEAARSMIKRQGWDGFFCAMRDAELSDIIAAADRARGFVAPPTPRDPQTSPSHTDLMISPEAIDKALNEPGAQALLDLTNRVAALEAIRFREAVNVRESRCYEEVTMDWHQGRHGDSGTLKLSTRAQIDIKEKS